MRKLTYQGANIKINIDIALFQRNMIKLSMMRYSKANNYIQAREEMYEKLPPKEATIELLKYCSILATCTVYYWFKIYSSHQRNKIT